MSYKYTNVREYRGGLIFDDNKNQKNVVVNSSGIEIYGKENSITQHTTFNADGITNNEKVNASYYDLKKGIKLYNKNSNFIIPQYDIPDAKATTLGLMSSNALGLAYISSSINRIISVDCPRGIKYVDDNTSQSNSFRIDGLYLTDGSGNTCYLKFEGGKLKINGKEIATLENS